MSYKLPKICKRLFDTQAGKVWYQKVGITRVECGVSKVAADARWTAQMPTTTTTRLVEETCKREINTTNHPDRTWRRCYMLFYYHLLLS